MARYAISFHDRRAAAETHEILPYQEDLKVTYTFENFFHPFVGELISKLNQESLAGIMDATWHEESLTQTFFASAYPLAGDPLVEVESSPKEIDVSEHGPYANYNWELFFHFPLAIAVHLSKTQRFAEAQRWFHYIFNPTSSEQTLPPSKRFWKFLAFRRPEDTKTIAEIVKILSRPRSSLPPDEQREQDDVMNGYNAIRNKPFQPHAVARTRHLAYQYSVVMKYLDNLIDWGDHLFQQDTVESINEATQIYVLAANILGDRPQQVPMSGSAKAKSFAQLQVDGLGPIGDALVALEGQFPFNLAAPDSGTGRSSTGDSSVLFGIGRTLYFCVPRNDKLLSYWDTVADRLFKIRHCMNIAGVVRPLALFDPPIDPGMLVKAAAAGIDISSLVSGLNQPIGPMRCLFLMQRALELCGEVRGLGNSLLAALEKGDGEHLAQIRQRHEIQIQSAMQQTRFLQWKQAQESTQSLLTSRATALERLHYYQRLLGLPVDQNAPDTIALDRRELTEGNFDEAYAALVGQYEKILTLQPLPALQIAPDSSSDGLATLFSGSGGSGRLYLNSNEDAELNSHLPRARDVSLAASTFHALSGAFAPVPDLKANLMFWGLGGTIDAKIGTALMTAARAIGDVLGIIASWEREQAGMASRTASYQRRADEWLLQYNLAAHELMQIGRQILTSLIAEQIAHHEYLTVQQQITNCLEVDRFLHEKFTNEQLYLWMQGEISRLYYEYYRFAFDTARKAERTMKQELMRPEVDAQDFIKFNYWDGGRKGLLSGEALYLDVKRLEMAYHESNKRELELIRHVSLRQLNPVALLTLKSTGTCQVTIPEWLYDLDCPGHYMRRIKSVAVSIPSVVGPYTSLNCTLSLLKSSLRKSPLPKDGQYGRQGSGDDRFVDYIGAVQSIVTSGGTNDSGLFETNLRDERFLPFEGTGAESTWKLDLSGDYHAFDYNTIADVVLHVRYTARQGVVQSLVNTTLKELFKETNQSNLALFFSLRHDFPSEWAAFINESNDFQLTVRKDHFPYFTQAKEITITIASYEIYAAADVNAHHEIGNEADWAAATDSLNEGNTQSFNVRIPVDNVAGPTRVMTRTAADVFLLVRYSLAQ